MRDPVREYDRPAARYWYVDGLVEIAGGVAILLLALVFLVGALLEPGPTTDLFLAFGQPAIVLAGALGARRAVSDLKQRLTYPRTGYVLRHRPRGARSLRMVALLLGVAAVVAVIYGIFTRLITAALVPAISGAVIGLLLAFLAYESGNRRFYILALYTLILGLLVVMLMVPDSFTSFVFFGGFGLGWVVSGAVALRRYLRDTRPITPHTANEPDVE